MNHKSSLLSSVGVLILWLTVILGCGNLPQNKRSSNSSEPPISITALALVTAYEDSEAVAAAKYNGKNLLVTGEVSFTDTYLGETYVMLKGKEMSMDGVKCLVDNSQKSAVPRLQEGRSVTVQGTCKGKNVFVELKNCVIK